MLKLNIPRMPAAVIYASICSESYILSASRYSLRVPKKSRYVKRSTLHEQVINTGAPVVVMAHDCIVVSLFSGRNTPPTVKALTGAVMA